MVEFVGKYLNGSRSQLWSKIEQEGLFGNSKPIQSESLRELTEAEKNEHDNL